MGGRDRVKEQATVCGQRSDKIRYMYNTPSLRKYNALISKIFSNMLKPERRMKVSLTTLDKLLDPVSTLRYYLQNTLATTRALIGRYSGVFSRIIF